MKHYAPVGPAEMLRQLARCSHLGSYHLLLAHDVVAHPKEYLEAFKATKVKIDQFTIIMDNSVIELGKPVSWEMLYEARKVFPSSILVLPDVLGNASETVRQTVQAMKELQRIDDPVLGPPYMTIMQGNTLDEFIQCARELNAIVQPNWWGIPRYATGVLGTRHELITRIHDLWPSKPIHLMGFSDDLMDDVTCTRRDGIAGIDSAVPLRIGMKNRHIETALLHPDTVPKRGSYWEDAKTYNVDGAKGHVLNNIKRMELWIQPRV